jgi:hypothetical protein
MNDDDGEDEESPDERANRELSELFNELRVALPGVQVLFGFLLTVPFTQRFGELDATDRRVYYAAVVTTALSTLFFIAPTAHHRLSFRSGVRERLLPVANAFALVGVVLLAIAMSFVTYLITDMLYSSTAAAVAAACLGGAFAIVWFVLPFTYRAHPDSRSRPDAGD